MSHSLPNPALKTLQRNLNRSTFVVWEMKRNVSVVPLILATRSSGPPASGKIIKEMPGSVASETPYIIKCNQCTAQPTGAVTNRNQLLYPRLRFLLTDWRLEWRFKHINNFYTSTHSILEYPNIFFNFFRYLSSGVYERLQIYLCWLIKRKNRWNNVYLSLHMLASYIYWTEN